MINQTSSTTTNTAQQTKKQDNPYVNPDGILGKDDFMKLMLIELQYQDPTEPMDSEKILQQTSQLATLESSDNTRKTLEKLSASLLSSQRYAILSAIGKIASLQEDTITHKQGETTSFELYFPTAVSSGTIKISDTNGNLIRTIDLDEKSKGVYAFEWDGKDSEGRLVEDGVYRITSDYYDDNGDARSISLGAYPIDSVRFEDGEAKVKLGSRYISLERVKEIYGG